MLFVTVGAQMSFDRLVRGVDRWAGDRGRSDVFAQIGPTDLRPANIKWTQFLDPPRFREAVEQASVIVAHAGMGSILTALELGKPILVMPRRGDLMETRNDHQIATARQLQAQGRVSVAYDEAELIEQLDRLENLHAAKPISPKASPMLLGMIQAFVRGEDVVGRLRSSIGAAMARMADQPLQGDVAQSAGVQSPVPRPQKAGV